MKEMTNFRRWWIKVKMAFIPDGPSGDRARGKLYQPYLKKCGLNFKIASGAFIYNPNGLEAGNHVYIGFGTYLGAGEISLDDEVLIGNHVSITATNHLRKKDSYRFGGYKAEKIMVGRGTWLGGHSMILAGVKIPSGCVVAGGSVVTKTIKQKNSLIAGIPAKAIKKYK